MSLVRKSCFLKAEVSLGLFATVPEIAQRPWRWKSGKNERDIRACQGGSLGRARSGPLTISQDCSSRVWPRRAPLLIEWIQYSQRFWTGSKFHALICNPHVNWRLTDWKTDRATEWITDWSADRQRKYLDGAENKRKRKEWKSKKHSFFEVKKTTHTKL